MNHDEFRFKAQFADEVIDARIQLYWTDTYYLFLNNRLQGVLMKREDSWRFAASTNQDYNSDDLLVLAEIIETNLTN